MAGVLIPEERNFPGASLIEKEALTVFAYGGCTDAGRKEFPAGRPAVGSFASGIRTLLSIVLSFSFFLKKKKQKFKPVRKGMSVYRSLRRRTGAGNSSSLEILMADSLLPAMAGTRRR